MTKLQKRKIKALSIFILKVLTIILILQGLIHLLKYPEICSTTLRHQLHQDLTNNDADAWTYYENNYLASDIVLFQDIISLS
ncbi:MAG: hypothetical protein IJX99_01395 [Clostridia bacterium]|nr:hypothetical protein [Clostridia bacterium]